MCKPACTRVLPCALQARSVHTRLSQRRGRGEESGSNRKALRNVRARQGAGAARRAGAHAHRPCDGVEVKV